MDYSEVTQQEQIFQNSVKNYIILGVLAITLYVLSYVTLCHFKKKADHEEMYAGEEDAVVYRIALWLCTVTLTVSVGAVLLLPISIISNEVLLLYPTSYWIKWLNSSLVQGLWNLVFFFSNLALFILMPFAYFFTEAEGFSGSRKGLMARVKEASLVLILLGLIVMGLFYIASTIISGDEKSKQTLQDVWYEHLPYLYSCISFFAVLALLMCTPVGVARMFTVMGRLIVKPQFLRDIEEELNTVRFEEENLLRKIKHRNGPAHLNNGHVTSVEELRESLKDIQKDRKALESRQHISFWRRNLCYPVVMLLLLAITVFSILIVVQNIIRLLLGTQSLPSSVSENALGIASLSSFGSVGAALQIAVILYLMVASVVGFYSLPYMKLLQPRPQETSMVQIIANCVVLLLLSSALPILSKTLGITNFDLLGKFGSMEWLRKFYIIFLYNAVFVVSTALCLVQKFTSPVWRGIYARLRVAFSRDGRGAGETTSVVGGASGVVGNGVGTKDDSFKEE
ncbi:hypothetical protein EGW08_008735 [Elysia chlorotica]|uniref:Uncharacterized protein n=1 Tax=Elysia chlorotica TaxID=188477 RepID=A0A3S1BGK8_ELYCH|nr:hypothetical protein EGW08_008735 [Elysia chlorotica]